MENNPFESMIESGGNCWTPKNPSASSIASQHILLDGSEVNFSHPVHGKDVVVMASRASGLDQEGVGSSMVKFKPIVNYDWECKHEYGNLVVCHTNKVYFAYVLKSHTQGTSGGIVRVTNMKTTQRTLLKNFVGKVSDLGFADSERIILGAVDFMGNLFVYELFEDKDQTLNHKLLLNCTRPDKSLGGLIHRLIWCSYIGEDEKPASDVAGSADAEAPLDDSLMLLLTHNEVAELWHVDLITRVSSNVQVTTDSITCGFYVIRNHSQAITDAAFSPDATAVATASLDGDVKFFQVDVTDSNPPKCIHYWKPHDGKPISFLHFLDDHKNKNPQAHLWKFAVTGCNENQTIRIWDCQNWSCLQSIAFVSPLMDLLNMEEEEEEEEETSRDFRARSSSIKAMFDLSSSYLVLSDLKRRVIYVLEVKSDGNEARIDSISEFLLMNPCMSFAVVDACQQKGSGFMNNGDNGFQGEQDWNMDNSEDDFEGVRLQRSSVFIKLYTVHSKALQELNIKFSPKSAPYEGSSEVREVANAAPDFPSVSSIRDLFPGMGDGLPSISKGSILTPSTNFSAISILSAPVHSAQVTSPPAGNQSCLGGFQQQQERQSSISSASNLSQTPFLLAPDAFVSPRETGRGALSSSVDFGGDDDEEEEDDDNEVEVRGDVEGADRDRPDGGSRVRSSGGGHFFDRGGDGGGDGDSSGASTASQEVTEILEGVEEAMGGLDVAMDQGKNSDEGDVPEDEKFSGSHLRAIDPQPTQHPAQIPVVQPHQHHPFMQQQQQHNIAHHIPNILQMPLPAMHLYNQTQVSSSGSKMSLDHRSILSSTQSPRSILQPIAQHHQASNPSHSSPMNTKWPQAAGIINVDELMRKSEALEMSHKDKRGHEVGASLPFIEADELERRFFNTKDVPLEDLLELVRSQTEELKSINQRLQQQSQLENYLRTTTHQIEALSKELRLLTATIDRNTTAASFNNIDEEKLDMIFERHTRKLEEGVTEPLRLFIEQAKGCIGEQFGKTVSTDIKTKLEQSLDSLREKLLNELNHKLSSVDATIKNNISKVFKTKQMTEGIGQYVSADLKGSLKSIHQDILVPSFEKGCSTLFQQLNSTFQTGTQQYIKNLESHLNQLRKSMENQKYPVIQQMKATADALTQNNAQHKQANAQLLSAIEQLQMQVQENSAKRASLDESKLLKILNEQSECMANQVRDIVSEKLACILRDHQVAIKDQFESALRSVTPAPSTSSFSDHHQQMRAQVSQHLLHSNYNHAFQQALSASDLSLVEFTCENADTSTVFGDKCLLNQSVLLSLIQQLAADLSTKTELKYRYLDEAIISLDPNDPITKEHLNNVLDQLCSNLVSFLDRNGGGPLERDLRKLLKRVNVLLRTHPRNKY